MTAYLDSSAMFKLLVDDEETDSGIRSALDLLGSISTSRLTYVETRAALAAARRAGRLHGSGFEVAVEDFEAAWETFAIIEVTAGLAKDAAIVSETFGLRAGDAIQLASVRALHLPEVTVVAWDRRLRTAATAGGFACFPREV